MSFGFKFDPFSKGGISAPDLTRKEDGELNMEHLEQIAKVFNTPAFKTELELAVYEIWQNATKENFDVCMATAENLRLLYTRFENLTQEYHSHASSIQKVEEYENDAEQQLDTL